jgi:membrane protease YdiL (CAAX protease family)
MAGAKRDVQLLVIFAAGTVGEFLLAALLRSELAAGIGTMFALASISLFFGCAHRRAATGGRAIRAIEELRKALADED